MTVSIEKDIPYRPRTKYPFAEMEVGDSFFKADSERAYCAIAQAATRWKVKHAGVFAVRKVTEGGVAGTRC